MVPRLLTPCALAGACALLLVACLDDDKVTEWKACEAGACPEGTVCCSGGLCRPECVGEYAHCQVRQQSTVQPLVQQLDILFVIDNSGTMREEQEALAENFEVFAEKLVESDASYQIGIVTTDVEADGGRLQTEDGDPEHKVIKSTWTHEDIVEVFRLNAVQGTAGTSFEKGLEAIREALSPSALATPLEGGGNQGFLRADSTLGIVIVSDEDDCSHAPCAAGDRTCIQEDDPLFECEDKADSLVPVAEFYDFLVDEDGAGPDTGLREPRRVRTAAIIGVRDETEQQVNIRTKEGEVRPIDVACWPIDPHGKVPAQGLGSGGQLAVMGGEDDRGANFTVPEDQHVFSDEDTGLWLRIVGATEPANNGVFRIQSLVAGENAVYLNRGDDLFASESGLSWELGDSPGMATEGSRYADFVSQFDRSTVSSICTFDWQEALDRVGASFTVQFDTCLRELPAGVSALLAEAPNPRDACPSIQSFVTVQVDGEEIACDDDTRPWYIVPDPVICQQAGSFKVAFPEAMRQDCTAEPAGPGCFPPPGARIDITFVETSDAGAACPGLEDFGL